jgi:tRNA-(ms[2]io[6]A)-hydroxylase
VVLRLVDLAEEELSHFRRVVAMLDERGIPLGPPSVDPYAAELRRLSQGRPSPFRGVAAALVDRMLVASLIEARSCERFRLLRDGLRAMGRDDLWPFYDELLAAEAGHFRVFVDLAVDLADGAREGVRARLALFADAEGGLCARLGAEPTIHG